MGNTGLLGGGAAPMLTANGSPGGIRPMPRPATLGSPAAGQPQVGPLGQFIGPQGSDQRYQMAMDFLKTAMASAPGSSNPLVQLLTPMLGGVMTARTTKLHDDKRAADVSAMTESVLGVSGLSAEAKRYQAIMDNEAAPAYLRDIARRKFQAEIAPPQGSGGGSRRSGSGGGNTTAAAPASGGRLVGEYWINGVLHGRNSSGQMIPYKGPDGAPVTQDAPAGATPPPVAAANPDDPLNIMPSDPLGLR